MLHAGPYGNKKEGKGEEEKYIYIYLEDIRLIINN